MKTFVILISIILVKNVFALTINDSVKSTIENNKKVQIAFEKLNESKETIEKSIGKKLNLLNLSLFIIMPLKKF